MSDGKAVSFLAIKEQANKAIKSTVDNILGTATYNPKEVQTWVDAMAQGIVEKLTDLNGNFKYIVSSIILQRSHAGFHCSTTCYWDYNTDGSLTFRWENKSMLCIITVFGVAL
uniref:Dynein light chain Tctex-type 1 n=1 Tax=Chromera velia CCMP2878 TaxID=1169474 RepID=A0A0G4HAI0_9ALVE|mmetsp:Transcript_55481/g.108638  ORF Transcript_55481/g.108638 Transcript_55481/m.108638 type:complete len:113 (-) Transcript_55481:372-710(-)|eukprot:Cvel_25551.t1-p1 / transcript=Cvel_25551.t1 / gene=Cvel_25551 / organism=Chromera_velia_CCMP2878 / gene_product=Dynein light chain Tctex-type 1, putative / transcript_product=Dynein light chain Tctex-type 1, putative / location=Cvel_scaffold2909:19011-19346(-) / protein_length=112 / sequence_SO=supercontig / SO=protein_coding / is_pseudo=false